MTEKYFNLEAEQALLGTLLFDNDALDRLDGVLFPEHFFEQFHGRLFAAIQEEARAGRLAEAVLLVDKFKDEKAFQDLGGMRYFADLVDRAPPSANAKDYARAISNLYQLRQLSAFVKIPEGVTDAQEVLLGLKEAVEAIDAQSPAEDDLTPSGEAANDFFDKLSEMAEGGKTLGIPTGLESFDEVTGGFCPGDLIVLAGSASMGKTALARNLLYRAAPLNPDLLFPYYSLEMPIFQIKGRAISEAAYRAGVKIPYKNYKKPTPAMISDLGRFKNELPKNILLSDKTGLSVDDIERSIRKIVRLKGKVGAVVIDHLHKMRVDHKGFDPYGQVTGRFKNLAMELGITIVLLCQLSRAFMSRDNKRPNVSDLRQSGSIEQDADVVLFPWREWQILKDEKPRKADAIIEWEEKMDRVKRNLTLIFAKVRSGEVCDKDLWCNLAFDIIDEKPAPDPTAF